ncbi:agmatine deiminase [Bengtsoniella intestinalis]|uniref:agmatine deiminase n=1 Tax=Bengtsoniella intestinalis TaxID=3073143 RepID=UPI00391FC717
MTSPMTTPMTTPKNDGFFMPAEFSAHQGTVMIWPVRAGSWPDGGVAGQRAFLNVATAIAQGETVYLLANPEDAPTVEAQIAALPATPHPIELLPIQSNDAWARDTAPTFVVNGDGALRGIDWQFNAWGGDFDGLYLDYDQDDLLASRFANHLGIPCYDAHPFVLEGGAIHSDGEGTVMVTASCLLSQGRNPSMEKLEITAQLQEYLGAEKILWLPRGIFNDETTEHVDNICAFVAPATVVLAWTDDESDPQYPLSKACYDYLATQTDSTNRPLTIHKLPVPKQPIALTEAEIAQFTFAEGELPLVAGERLPASYVNFYITNTSVLVPQFGDVNDAVACQMLEPLFPLHKIVPIAARDILVGGGNIHCITQQIPKGGVGL